MHIDKLDDIVNKYYNIYHNTIKMKPVDVKSSTHIDFDRMNYKKHPKLTVSENVRTLKFIIFVNVYVPNWSEEAFVIKKVKNTVPWANVISDLNSEKIVVTFYEKVLQKTNQKEFEVKKVFKRKGDKLYVKWKGYDNSSNTWIDKKDIA